MPFLPPNQQRQSTEGNNKRKKYKKLFHFIPNIYTAKHLNHQKLYMKHNQ